MIWLAWLGLGAGWTEVIAMVAAYVIAVVTTPAGIFGAVLLLPFQVSVLGMPSPAVTPTNLLYNVVATPGDCTATDQRIMPITPWWSQGWMRARACAGSSGCKASQDQCRYSPAGPVPGSLMASGWGSPVRAARAVATSGRPART